VTTLVSSGLSRPTEVAVDGSGNVYFADTDNNAIKEITFAFVSGISLDEPGKAGADSLPPVLPATTPLTGIFAPASDQSWLTIGTISNGVVHFSFTANTSGSSRRAHITVLGQPIAVTQAPGAASLSILKSHSGGFGQGQSGAVYNVVVSNASNSGPTSGTVTVNETIPSGLTLAAMAGAGWSCSGSSCTRSDVLAAGASYPAIAVTVNVMADAPAQVVNQVSVSGGGPATSNASDSTTIVPAQTPAASLSTPSGSGAVQTFTGTYYDAKGYKDLQWVQMLFAVTPDGGGTTYCFVHYDVQGNGFWLYGDGGFFLGPIAPGTPSNLLQNSLCALNTSASTVTGSGATLTVNAAVVFKAAAARNIYLRAMNGAQSDTGWVQVGTWGATAAALGTLGVSLNSGASTHGVQQTFQLTYPDPQGFAGAAFGWVQFLIAAATNGGGEPFCFVHYDRAGNGLWMYSSDVGFFLGPVTPGVSSSALTSSACSVNTASTTVTNSNGNLVLNIPITMQAPMVGAKNLYQRTLDVLNRDTGWQQSGTWTIQ
jgi:hypothetical protein